MLPTPDLSHFTASDYERIYEPAEDTFLLLDALEQDASTITQRHPTVCLEIGSGSGCVSTFIGKIIGPTNSLYICTDINRHACTCTKRTSMQNSVPLECINTSFARPFQSRLRYAVDVIMFNPPYVPTEEEEALNAQDLRDIQGAWAGGFEGMQVTNHFLQMVPDLLSPKGIFYLVALKTNDIPAIQKRMQDDFDLCSEIILQRRAGREHLFIVRFVRSSSLGQY